MSKMRMTAAAFLGATVLALGAASTASAQANCGDINDSGGDPDAIDTAGLAAVVLGGGTPVAGHCGGAGTLQCGDLVDDNSITTGDLVSSLQLAVGLEPILPPCTAFGPTLACGTTVSGTISTNTQFPAGCDTFLDGVVTVSNGATLTVQAGATVKGVLPPTTGDDASALLVLRGSKINAPGLPTAPIVFTSDQTPGTRAKEDWGGLVLLGEAPVNFPGGEGACEGLPPGSCNFGGNDPQDNSGLLRYARIEFCGRELEVDNELNCLTMNGIGNATTIDFVQANQGSDDGTEWFGGTVNAKHLVSTNAGDDNLDCQIGWSGNLQFYLGHLNISQIDGSGSNGIECDNNEFGFNNAPIGDPNVCNVTLVGCVQQGAACAIVGGTVGGTGANIRRGSAGTWSNMIIQDFRASGLDIDNDETINHACDNATTANTDAPVLSVNDTLLFNNGSPGTNQTVGSTSGSNNCTAANLASIWIAGNGLSIPGATPLPNVTGVYPTVVDNRYFPADEGIADNAPDCEDVNPAIFDSAPYIGAFDPNQDPGDNWLDTPGGWISFAIN
jgi:hypothetical protein